MVTVSSYGAKLIFGHSLQANSYHVFHVSGSDASTKFVDLIDDRIPVRLTDICRSSLSTSFNLRRRTGDDFYPSLA